MAALDWLPWRRNERATDPIAIAPSVGQQFGPGIGAQPSHERLLRESLGIADVATRAIANRVSSLNPQVMVTRGSGATQTDEILDGHPLKRLLDKPNPSFTRKQLLRLTAQWIVTVGEAYWLKVGSRLGTTVELHPIPPERVRAVTSGATVAGYVVTNGDGAQIPVESSDMVRIWYPDPANIFGAEGYLGPNGTLTDAARFSREHLRSHFENDAMPASVIQAGSGAQAPDADERRRFETKWAESYHRRKGASRGVPAWLPSDYSLEQLTTQYGAEIEPLLRYFTEEQLLNFGVPKSVLGQVVSGDRSSAETNAFVFDLHTVSAVSDLISDCLTSQLASDFDEMLWVRFEPFVAQDKMHELEREKSDLDRKVQSINQVLEARGGDPVTWGDLPVGTVGQTPYTGEEPEPLEFETVDALMEPDDEDEDQAEDDEGRTRALDAAYFDPEAAWRRLLKTERTFQARFERSIRSAFEVQRRNIVKRLRGSTPRARISADDLFDPREWSDLVRRVIPDLYQLIYRETGQETLGALVPRMTFLFTPDVIRRLDQHAADLVTGAGETTKKRLRRELAAGTEAGEGIDQLAKRVNTVFAGRRRNARAIARTEVLKASQEAQTESFRQSGVVERKQWNNSRDESVRESHELDGQIVNLGDDFTLANGRKATAPGDSRLPAEDVVNCRCFVTPVLE